MSDRKAADVSPFERDADGTYDLERWNDPYWDRLAAFLEETAERDIVVELTLWDQHDFATSRWADHAWNPANNQTLPEDSLPATGGDHWEDRIAFFRTVAEGNEAVLSHQERFVDRVLDDTLEYGNVIYNVTNEGWAGIEWERHWAEHVLNRARKHGVDVDVANMNMSPGDSVRKAIEHPETFLYVEVSQHNQDSGGSSGQEHWDLLQRWRSDVGDAVGPRPFNNVKIYGGFDGVIEAAGDADEAVETLGLPVEETTRPERDPAIIAAASGLLLAFAAVPVGLVLAPQVETGTAVGITVVLGPLCALPVGALLWAALSRV